MGPKTQKTLNFKEALAFCCRLSFSQAVYLLVALSFASFGAFAKAPLVNPSQIPVSIDSHDVSGLLSTRLRAHIDRSTSRELQSIDALMALLRLNSRTQAEMESFFARLRKSVKKEKTGEQAQLEEDLKSLSRMRELGLLSSESSRHLAALDSSSLVVGGANLSASEEQTLIDSADPNLSPLKSQGSRSSLAELSRSNPLLDLSLERSGSDDILALSMIENANAVAEVSNSNANSTYVEALGDAKKPIGLAKNQKSLLDLNKVTGASSAGLKQDFSTALGRALSLRAPFVSAPSLNSPSHDVGTSPEKESSNLKIKSSGAPTKTEGKSVEKPTAEHNTNASGLDAQASKIQTPSNNQTAPRESNVSGGGPANSGLNDSASQNRVASPSQLQNNAAALTPKESIEFGPKFDAAKKDFSKEAIADESGLRINDKNPASMRDGVKAPLASGNLAYETEKARFSALLDASDARASGKQQGFLLESNRLIVGNDPLKANFPILEDSFNVGTTPIDLNRTRESIDASYLLNSKLMEITPIDEKQGIPVDSYIAGSISLAAGLEPPAIDAGSITADHLGLSPSLVTPQEITKSTASLKPDVTAKPKEVLKIEVPLKPSVLLEPLDPNPELNLEPAKSGAPLGRMEVADRPPPEFKTLFEEEGEIAPEKEMPAQKVHPPLIAAANPPNTNAIPSLVAIPKLEHLKPVLPGPPVVVPKANASVSVVANPKPEPVVVVRKANSGCAEIFARASRELARASY